MAITFFEELSLNSLYRCFNSHKISAFQQAECWKQASSDLVWDALDDGEPAADTESTSVAIITGS